MTATTAQSYRKLLRHLKSLPTPPQNSYFFNLIQQIRDSPSSTSTRVLKSYAATCSSVTELNYLRGLDSGEKLDQREKIRQSSRRVGLDIPMFADEFNPNHNNDKK